MLSPPHTLPSCSRVQSQPHPILPESGLLQPISTTLRRITKPGGRPLPGRAALDTEGRGAQCSLTPTKPRSRQNSGVVRREETVLGSARTQGFALWGLMARPQQ